MGRDFNERRAGIVRLPAGGEASLLVCFSILLAGCQTSTSPSSRASGLARAGHYSEMREQIARLGQTNQLPGAGAVAGAGSEQEQQTAAMVADEEASRFRGQEPDLPRQIRPAGTVPPPLTLPPPPASLGIPTTGPKKKAENAKLNSSATLGTPESLSLGQLHEGGVVVATVNGQAILEEEVRLAIIQGGSGDGPPGADRRKLAIDTLVDRELVVQDCTTRLSKNPQAQKFLDKMKELSSKEFERYIKQIKDKNQVESEEEFERTLEAQGVPIDLMRRQSERNFIAMNYLQQRVMPALDRIGRAELQEYYNSHPDDFRVYDSVRWRHMFLARARFATPEEAMRAAEALAARVRAGEDFAELSRKNCHGDSALRGGEGIGRQRGEIKPPELEAMLFKMRPGEVAPVVELRTGYHIAQLVDREFEGKKPFDEKIQKQIRARLREEIAQREMKAVVTDLKRVSVVEYR